MCNCDRLIKAIDDYIEKADKSLEDILSAEGYAVPKKTVKRASAIEEAIAEALEEETEYFIESANTAIDVEEFASRIWPGVKLDNRTSEKVAEIFTEQLGEFLPELIEPYIKMTDKGLSLISVTKRTTAWVTSWSKELGEIMQLTSHNEIEKILKTNLEAGNGIESFVIDIMESGIRDERYRARTVAITEALRAHSVAQEEAIQQSPVVEEKEWRHTGAHKNEPRQNHIDMDGQVVPKNQPFTLIGADGKTYYPEYPRDTSLPPGESINCHCIHRGIVSEEILGLSLEERKALQEQAIEDLDDEWEKELDAKNKAKAGIEVP